jgi:CheY-like chemotaxis protein
MHAMKILVVDDVGYSRHFHARLMEKNGHMAVSAGSAAEALKMLRTDHGIDVVLTDLMMADMDGIELFEGAQELERVNDAGPVSPPRFILMTALHPGKNAQPRDVERIRLAKEVGFAEVLFKPIENDELMSLLERISSGRPMSPVSTAELVSKLQKAATALARSEDAEAINAFLEETEGVLAPLRDRYLQLAMQ